MDQAKDKRLHDSMRILGLRATPTAAGFLQLVGELEQAGVLDAAAVERIKAAMMKELCLELPPHMRSEDFERHMGQRLNRLFAGDEPLGERPYQAPRPE